MAFLPHVHQNKPRPGTYSLVQSLQKNTSKAFLAWTRELKSNRKGGIKRRTPARYLKMGKLDQPHPCVPSLLSSVRHWPVKYREGEKNVNQSQIRMRDASYF